MTLMELLKDVEYSGNAEDIPVKDLCFDSRRVEAGSVFFCIPGQRFDGHDHAAQALEKGAVAVICRRDLGLERQILVPDTRRALGVMSGNFFGNPAKKLRLIGVTGTNGKTTVTYLIKHILECAGKKVGLIGTIHNEIDDITLPAKYTTPDPVQLHGMLARMVAAGCDCAVMEVSSHSLDQQRVEGLGFECGVFTNLTQDHLDYHGDMESYYQAKKLLFAQCGLAVLNFDDSAGLRLLSEVDCPAVTYSCKRDDADFTARDIKFTAQGSRFALLTQARLGKVTFCMPGYFSVSNAMAAASACIAAGVEFDTVTEALSTCPGVTGRLEVLATDTPYTVIRDYAHSPDGLQKLLETVREFAPGRVVTLFGCAGNRDSTKRPKMAKIAATLSDFCILTSDNPRDEDPERIVNEAAQGFSGIRTPHRIIVDRYEAIRWALEHSRPGDTLILAGKGHEDYQVLSYGTIFFDEKVVVEELLNKTRGKSRSGGTG